MFQPIESTFVPSYQPLPMDNIQQAGQALQQRTMATQDAMSNINEQLAEAAVHDVDLGNFMFDTQQVQQELQNITRDGNLFDAQGRVQQLAGSLTQNLSLYERNRELREAEVEDLENADMPDYMRNRLMGQVLNRGGIQRDPETGELNPASIQPRTLFGDVTDPEQAIITRINSLREDISDTGLQASGIDGQMVQGRTTTINPQRAELAAATLLGLRNETGRPQDPGIANYFDNQRRILAEDYRMVNPDADIETIQNQVENDIMAMKTRMASDAVRIAVHHKTSLSYKSTGDGDSRQEGKGGSMLRQLTGTTTNVPRQNTPHGEQISRSLPTAERAHANHRDRLLTSWEEYQKIEELMHTSPIGMAITGDYNQIPNDKYPEVDPETGRRYRYAEIGTPRGMITQKRFQPNEPRRDHQGNYIINGQRISPSNLKENFINQKIQEGVVTREQIENYLEDKNFISDRLEERQEFQSVYTMLPHDLPHRGNMEDQLTRVFLSQMREGRAEFIAGEGSERLFQRFNELDTTPEDWEFVGWNASAGSMVFQPKEDVKIGWIGSDAEAGKPIEVKFDNYTNVIDALIHDVGRELPDYADAMRNELEASDAIFNVISRNQLGEKEIPQLERWLGPGQTEDYRSDSGFKIYGAMIDDLTDEGGTMVMEFDNRNGQRTPVSYGHVSTINPNLINASRFRDILRDNSGLVLETENIEEALRNRAAMFAAEDRETQQRAQSNYTHSLIPPHILRQYERGDISEQEMASFGRRVFQNFESILSNTHFEFDSRGDALSITRRMLDREVRNIHNQ